MPNIAKIIPSGPDSVFNWAIIDSAADLVLALARISPVLRLTVSRVRVHHPRYSVWWQSQWPESQHRIPPSFVITAASTHSHAASEQWCWWCMITMMLVRWCTDHSDVDDKVITIKMMKWCNDHSDADEMMHDQSDADDAPRYRQFVRRDKKAWKWNPPKDNKKRDVSGREGGASVSAARFCAGSTLPSIQYCSVYLVCGVIDSIMKSECSYLLCLRLTRTTQMCPP